MAQCLQLAGQCRVVFGETLILGANGRAGRDIDPPAVTVHHQLASLDTPDRQVGNGHRRGHPHTPRQDADMRGARAGGRDDPRQHLARDVGDLHRAELVADQDGVGHVLDRRRGQLLQMGQYAAAEIAHVGGALAQIGIVHIVEHLGVLGDGLAQRPGRPIAGADA